MGPPVVHFEIGCRNSHKTQEFYSRMLDGTGGDDCGRNRRHRQMTWPLT
jgi:hypothetical protein